MNCLPSFIITILFSSQVIAAVGQLAVKGGSWNFSTENVSTTSESSGGVGAYAFEIGYSFSPSWMATFGINLLMSDGVSGSAGFGFDLGSKYYYLSRATSSSMDSEYVSVDISEAWRPYVGLFMRQRTFGLATSVSYMGPGTSLGLDYCLSKKWLFNAEVRYDYLYGQGDALAKQVNFLVGLGVEF